MTVSFVVGTSVNAKFESSRRTFALTPDNWDDYSFKTQFRVSVLEDDDTWSLIGDVKLGRVGQTVGWSSEKLPKQFENLSPNWFSLGQDVNYYLNVRVKLQEFADAFLKALGDVVDSQTQFALASAERVFTTSLMRSVSHSVIQEQFVRALNGQTVLTPFEFMYSCPKSDDRAPVDLEFRVAPLSKPPTNVHVLIGRNGVGKTTILNGMLKAIIQREELLPEEGSFGYVKKLFHSGPLADGYFSSVVSVSFSAFDPFVPPPDRTDPLKGPVYFYVGMKSRKLTDNTAVPEHKTRGDLIVDFVDSFASCHSQSEKKIRWLAAIKRLESDSNFADMALSELMDMDRPKAKKEAASRAKRMSSGHAVVLLTITKLVDTVEEKTLVLMDEPESHLHPPLLSAFSRALSDLLHDRNGLAIIATHSPVVVQEVPKSCVWKLTRIRSLATAKRPQRETFGENVGVLTREVFGLEVTKSGFHEMLENAVAAGGTYESILQEYGDQFGFEAQGILRALIGDASDDETATE